MPEVTVDEDRDHFGRKNDVRLAGQPGDMLSEAKAMCVKSGPNALFEQGIFPSHTRHAIAALRLGEIVRHFLPYSSKRLTVGSTPAVSSASETRRLMDWAAFSVNVKATIHSGGFLSASRRVICRQASWTSGAGAGECQHFVRRVRRSGLLFRCRIPLNDLSDFTHMENHLELMCQLRCVFDSYFECAIEPVRRVI